MTMFNMVADDGTSEWVSRRPSPKSFGMPIEVAVPLLLERRYNHSKRTLQRVTSLAKQMLEHSAGLEVEQITTAHLMAFVRKRQAEGNKPATIKVKLSLYASLFDELKWELHRPDPEAPFKAPVIPTIREGVAVKWWLQPETEEKMVRWCRNNDESDLADYITWSTHTGCRVEETLRMRRQHFDFTNGTVTIPGTKTDKSQRTVPMMPEAAAVASRRLAASAPDTLMFVFSPSAEDTDNEVLAVYRSYTMLKRRWARCRDIFGLYREPTATLKSLRRTFARYATDKGMPTQMLQKYLGHSVIETTTGYLDLVGGFNLEAMRKWVS